MKRYLPTFGFFVTTFFAAMLAAGPRQIEPGQATVPRLIQFSGVLKTQTGQALNGTVGVTFALYSEQDGSAPLWLETQNVGAGEQGRFAVLLGAATKGGIPAELFTSGKPRWLGVQANVSGEPEQPRVLLVSVPYALKASDAETLGGKPLSAFVLAPTDQSAVASGTSAATKSSTADTTSRAAVTGGTPSTLPLFDTDGVSLTDSVVKQSGTFIGLGTKGAPTSNLHIEGAPTGNPEVALNLQNTGVGGRAYRWASTGNTSAFGGGRLILQDMQANGAVRFSVNSNGYVGIGTSNPAEKLDVNGYVQATAVTITSKNLALPVTSSMGTGGVITSGGNRLLHTFGTGNVFLGMNAGNFTLTGNNNTAAGTSALYSNTSGFGNAAIGKDALYSNTDGQDNTAIGRNALYSSTSGNQNTASGGFALYSNTLGNNNTANGYLALHSNTAGGYNTALGHSALSSNTTGSENAAIGAFSLLNNSTGNINTAIGYQALLVNTSGTGNTAIGYNAGGDHLTGGNGNSTGSNNTFIGKRARPGTPTQLHNATAIGANAMVSANNALVLGDDSVSVGIGTSAPADKLDVKGDIRVGTSNTGCVKDSAGTAIAGTCSSDARLKRNVEPFGAVLETLVQLQPVYFDWKSEEYPERNFGTSRSFGLLAQEVEKVMPDLVTEDAQGYKAVKYSQLPLLLLQALRELKAQETLLIGVVKQQDAEIKQLTAEVQTLKARP